MKKNFSAALIATLFIFLFSCKSTTVIHSAPEGAKLYINEEYKGTTPYKYSDTKVSGTKTAVRLDLSGYEPFAVTLKRNERTTGQSIAQGIFSCGIAFAWVMRYNKEHTYELKPKGSAATKQ